MTRWKLGWIVDGSWIDLGWILGVSCGASWARYRMANQFLIEKVEEVQAGLRDEVGGSSLKESNHPIQGDSIGALDTPFLPQGNGGGSSIYYLISTIYLLLL